MVGDLTRASGTYETPHGTVRSSWAKKGSRTTFTIEIPPGSTATVVLPNEVDSQSKGATRTLRVGAGSHTFAAPAPQ